MISFIIPATDKTKIKKLTASLDQLGIVFEVIPIYGATSFFDAWRKGIKKAKYEYLCFTHQDTEFIGLPDLDKYFTGNVGMVGVAGTTVIHQDQPWWFSKERFYGFLLSGQIYHKEPDGSNSISAYGGFGDVVILDGVCMITKKSILEKVGIPKVNYANWDFYDHIISLEYIKKGYRLLTVPIVMVHYSPGGGQKTFDESALKFREDYLKKTWRI